MPKWLIKNNANIIIMSAYLLNANKIIRVQFRNIRKPALTLHPWFINEQYAWLRDTLNSLIGNEF